MSIEGELNVIVREFLEQNGFEGTCKLFEEECREQGKPLDLDKIRHSREQKVRKIKDDLLHYFSIGEESRFFLIWSSHLTPAVLNCSKELLSEASDLELELRVHFAVHPQRNPNADKLECEESMLRFRTFLESKGSAMSESSLHLHYYALPYVSKLRDHQTFGKVFSDEWLDKLRTRLEKYTDDVLQMSDTVSARLKPTRLSYLYHCADSELNDLRVEMSVLEKRLEETTSQNSTTTRQLLRLEEEHQRLMGVTGELINALESAIQGRVVDMENILSYCQREVPNLLAQLSNRSALRTDGSPESPDDLKVMDSTTGSDNTPASSLVAYELNYHLIKNELLRSDIETKCRLIQALRWQLTKCGSLERRHSTLMAFISHDLLGCFKRQSEYATRLLHLLRSPSTRLQQGLYRLINAFASFCKGRSYLARNPQLISVMVDSLVDGQLETVARDMVVASLQKLSLRRSLAVIMVDGGAMGWLLKTLPLGCNAEGSLNSYSFEYATALFMNLCLCPRGRQACSAEAQLTIEVIVQLYDRNVSEILPYLNGALYSLITDRDLLNEARARKLKDKLQQLRNGFPEELSKQVNCILEKLETDAPIQEEREDEKNSLEEEETSAQNDETEMEIDQGEPSTLEDAVMGETLLWKMYTQPNKSVELNPRRSISTGGSRVRRQTQAVNPMPNNQETRKSRSSGRKSPFASELPAISSSIRKANLVNGLSTSVVPSTDSANVLQVTPLIRMSPPEPVNLPEILNTPSALDSIHPDTVFAARPKVPRTPEGGRR